MTLESSSTKECVKKHSYWSNRSKTLTYWTWWDWTPISFTSISWTAILVHRVRRWILRNKRSKHDWRKHPRIHPRLTSFPCKWNYWGWLRSFLIRRRKLGRRSWAASITLCWCKPWKQQYEENCAFWRR